MQKNNKHLSSIGTIGFAAVLTLALPIFAFAATTVSAQAWAGSSGGMHRGSMPPGVFGTVSAVNGTSLTVTAQSRPNMATSTPPIVYTVDGTNAKVYKGPATSTVSISSIAVGDKVMVQGALSGTNVAATVIRDGIGGVGMMLGRLGMPGGRGFGSHSTSTPPGMPVAPAIQGNGEPVIGGNVTEINGSTLTVANASNVTYTVDVTSAKILKNGTSTTLASVATGDSVIVQGTVNGTAVTASSVIDQGAKPAASTTASSGSASAGVHAGFGGFFGAIGGFFQHLFGF